MSNKRSSYNSLSQDELMKEDKNTSSTFKEKREYIEEKNNFNKYLLNYCKITINLYGVYLLWILLPCTRNT